jgi:hypothetical protein
MGLESPRINSTIAGTTVATVVNADDLEVDSGTLSVDADNNRVGVGVTDPDSTLEVFSATTQQKWSYDADSFATITVADASHTTVATGETGDLILDAGDDIILDSHVGKWRMKRNGTLTNMISALASDGSSMIFDNQVSDADYIFKCSDGGVGITALTIDASEAGAATFNSKIIATELDISGDCDIDGTMEADAITVGGKVLGEVIADTVGAMVGSNTESGITVAYQDADNTLDFTVGTLNQDTSGTAAIATTVTVADESSDTSCNVLFTTAATGDLAPKSGTNLTFNSSSGLLTATQLAGTLTTAAQTNITSVGTIGTGVWQGTAIAQAYIANDAINGDKIADNAVNSEHYTDGSIDTDHIADDQVTLAKMAGLARGKIIVGDSSGNPSALTLGSDTYVLTSDGNDVIWAAAAGGAAADDSNTILHMQVFA